MLSIWWICLFIIKILHLLSTTFIFLLSSCCPFFCSLITYSIQNIKAQHKSWNSLNLTYGPTSCLSICQTFVFQPIKVCQNQLLELCLSTEQSKNTARPRVRTEGYKGFLQNRQWQEWMSEGESKEEKHLKDKEDKKGLMVGPKKQQPSEGLPYSHSANSVRKSLKGKRTDRALSDIRVCLTAQDSLKPEPHTSSPIVMPPYSYSIRKKEQHLLKGYDRQCRFKEEDLVWKPHVD